MARIPLQVRITLDTVHCHKESDSGSCEPYLWTVFFKVDGDTVTVGDDLFLHGVCTLTGTPGSHGNLGDDDVDAGDDVTIPAAIGEFQTILRPIPVSAFPNTDVGGVVGVVVVLMEEDWVTNAGAEAGHAALNIAVRQGIDGIISDLGVMKPEVNPEQIDDLAESATSAVRAAIKESQGRWDNFTSWLHTDDVLGTEVFLFRHDSLLQDAFQNLRTRWKKFREFQNLQIVVDDWELSGRIEGVPLCPITAIASTLKAQGVLGEAEIDSFIEAADQFRSSAFAGRRGLGVWWELAERNSAAIAGILRAHPDLALESAAITMRALGDTVRAQEPVSDDFVSSAANLLKVFVAHGPRRLRIDAKAALAVLPELRGRTIHEVSEILETRTPTRRVDALAT